MKVSRAIIPNEPSNNCILVARIPPMRNEVQFVALLGAATAVLSTVLWRAVRRRVRQTASHQPENRGAPHAASAEPQQSLVEGNSGADAIRDMSDRTTSPSTTLEDATASKEKGPAMSSSSVPVIPELEDAIGIVPPSEEEATPVHEITTGQTGVEQPPGRAGTPPMSSSSVPVAPELEDAIGIVPPSKEEPTPVHEITTGQTGVEQSPGRAGSGRSAEYRPSIRTVKTTHPTSKSHETRSDAQRTRSLTMSVHVVFDRRNRCRVSLLPARTDNLDEIIEVSGPNGPETWTASQDEWYSDILPRNLGTLLERGSQWQSVGDPELQWLLSGREIYVLARSSTIAAFVSVPRLSLQEDHLVLSRKEQEEAVRKALGDAGCSNLAVTGAEGVPCGWLLFRNVRPKIALLHDDAAGIFNVLRPIHDIEIVLRGGIRLDHANWLYRHPPQISVRGGTSELKVQIDGLPTTVDAVGNYQAANGDEPGKHTVFCGGVVQFYNLVDGTQEWDAFEAFVYRPRWDEHGDHSVTICGPLVAAANGAQRVFLSTAANMCFLGAAPGQIIFMPGQRDAIAPEVLAIADFPVVWALPSSPLQSDRSVGSISLVHPHNVHVQRGAVSKASRRASLRWCYAILQASYKRLRVEPDSTDTKRLWKNYKNEAHRLKKKLR